MIYSDWQKELSEGVKTRLLIKALKGAQKLSKKLGRKVKGSVENIGATKAGGRLKMNDVVNRPVKPNKPTLKKGESWTGGGTRDGKAIPTRNLSARYKTYIKKKQKYDKDIKDFNDKLIKDRKDAVDTSKIGDNPSARAKIRDILDKINKKKGIGEEVMAAPTNNVGGGRIAGTVEAGDDPPVKKKKKKKKKTYAYGGRGSRKMWMNNK